MHSREMFSPRENLDMDTGAKQPNLIEPHLGLWDAVSIIVGIIIGVGIFWTPNRIFEHAPHPAIAIGLWGLGGVLALIGALCFAELASAYPRSGGEYVYLTRAFGPLTGFLFAWSQLTVTRSGSVAGMAYIFGEKAQFLFKTNDQSAFLFAGASVIVLTIINILGVRMGTRTQNILTVAKLLGLVTLIFVGFAWGSTESAAPVSRSREHGAFFVAAMIFVLWTYSGWHEAAYIVAEAKNHTRNIPLALILGTLIVTAIYILINLAFLCGLGAEAVKKKDIAERLLDLAWPTYGARAMAILIMVSSLGAINGMIFTTARIYSEFGKDHRIFKMLSHWSKHWKTPARALLIQGGVCLALIAGVWRVGSKDGFDYTVRLTAAVFWSFFCLTGVALIVLRRTDADTPRPFRVPGYPVLPIIFSCWCAYMAVGTVFDDIVNFSNDTNDNSNNPYASLIGLAILAAGLPFYFMPKKLRERKPDPELQPVDN